MHVHRLPGEEGNLSDGMPVDITLTCTTHLNIVTDQVFMARVSPNGSGLSLQDGAPRHTAKVMTGAPIFGR